MATEEGPPVGVLVNADQVDDLESPAKEIVMKTPKSQIWGLAWSLIATVSWWTWSKSNYRIKHQTLLSREFILKQCLQMMETAQCPKRYKKKHQTTAEENALRHWDATMVGIYREVN